MYTPYLQIHFLTTEKREEAVVRRAGSLIFLPLSIM